VKDSIQIVRGCFGGCTFCSIAIHEGRIIQSRSRKSVLAEIDRMAASPDFSGTISDLGGPTANMYQMNCTRPEQRDRCRRSSCLYPAICRWLNTDHGPFIELLEAARRRPGVKRALVASGIRMDLALRSPEFIKVLARHHTGGLLKVAPEHTDPEVLHLMHKPPIETFEAFAEQFQCAAAATGREQYLVPYFIAGHPGCDLHAMIELAVYLKRHGLKPDKVQEFIPGPMDAATCMYYTGLDPFSDVWEKNATRSTTRLAAAGTAASEATGPPCRRPLNQRSMTDPNNNGESAVYVPRGGRERRLQRALLQYFKPENYADVREALAEAGRLDLVGEGPDCLIPSRPPKITVERKPPARRGGSKPTVGYRPHRKTAKRKPNGTSWRNRKPGDKREE